jgi:hypothetical protein
LDWHPELGDAEDGNRNAREEHIELGHFQHDRVPVDADAVLCESQFLMFQVLLMDQDSIEMLRSVDGLVVVEFVKEEERTVGVRRYGWEVAEAREALDTRVQEPRSWLPDAPP